MIRPAHEADLALIPAIEESAAQLFADVGLAIPDDGAASPIDYWRSALDEGSLWVVTDERDTPIGYVACVSYGDVLYVQQIDVHRAHQRQGLGRQMMAAAIEGARKMGRSALALTTFRSVPFNGPFYASLGFVEADDPPAWLGDILADEHARGMRGRCGMILALAG